MWLRNKNYLTKNNKKWSSKRNQAISEDAIEENHFELDKD